MTAAATSGADARTLVVSTARLLAAAFAGLLGAEATLAVTIVELSDAPPSERLPVVLFVADRAATLRDDLATVTRLVGAPIVVVSDGAPFADTDRAALRIVDHLDYGSTLAGLRAALERAAGGSAGRVRRSTARRETAHPANLLLKSLSPREIEVVELLSQGKSTDDIAASLGIARATVRTHVQNLMTKLGARTREAAVAVARGTTREQVLHTGRDVSTEAERT